jgi:two-component system, NarL family, sensor histidine kinase DevS
MEQRTLRHLFRAARRLTAERDLDRALASAVAVAREITGAQHGALAVLDPAATSVARFVIRSPGAESDEIEWAAAAPPALQAELIMHPVPLRRAGARDTLGTGEAAAEAPPTWSFLAVPIMVGADPWGHLYLADAGAGEFTDDDVQAMLVLGALVSTAVRHAEAVNRLPPSSEGSRRELRRAEAIIAMARVLEGEPRLQEVLDVIAEEGQQFLGAGAFVVFLPVGDQLEAVSAALDTATPVSGFSLPLGGALVDPVFRGLQVAHLRGEPRPEEVGLRRWLDAHTGLLVPVPFVGSAVAVVAAFDPRSGAPGFDASDERLLRSFAESAAPAIVTTRLVQSERAERRASERGREGTRLARELHDETLQALGLLRLSLSSALETEKNESLTSAVEAAIVHIDYEIEELRRLIDELQPSLLQALGLVGALRALAENAAAEGELEVETNISLAGLHGPLPAEVEHALYRTAQEALTNVVKHADASRVELDLQSDTDAIALRVGDDGRGIGARPGRIGFGLLAMRARIEAAGGDFDLSTSATGGTSVRATFASVREPGGTRETASEARTD